MTALINKKLIIIGILAVVCSLCIIPFVFKFRTTGKVISGGSTTCHCLPIKPDGSIDYDHEKDLIINCTIEFKTWSGSTCSFTYDRSAKLPVREINNYIFRPGDTVEIEYNPLFPWSATIVGLP